MVTVRVVVVFSVERIVLPAFDVVVVFVVVVAAAAVVVVGGGGVNMMLIVDVEDDG